MKNSIRAVRARSRKAAVLVVGLTATALVLAGCSTGASSGSTASSGADTGFVAAATKTVDEHYSEKSFIDPPTSGPKAETGKNVWWMSCGSQFDTCNNTAKYFQDAGKLLGWKVTVFDTKGDPTVAAQGIRQAIADKADAISGQTQDCSGRSSALQAAKAAGIKVVMMLSEDCANANAGPNLFDSEVKFGGTDSQKAWTLGWGATKAQYFVSKLKGNVKIIDVTLTDQLPVVEIDDGFLQGLKSCTSCKVVDTVKFTVPDIPAGIVSKLQTALIQHPEANAIHIPFDSLMTFGIIPVIQRSGLNVIVGGGEGDASNADFIRAGSQTFSLAFPYEWITWATADTLNRVLASQPTVQEGGGYVFVDKDHNLPASGAWQPTFDFKSSYEKIWG